jgi:predicted transcriptional regulator of viral defense system
MSITTPNHHRLYEIAEPQGGYFTAQQARQAGFTRQLIAHHVRSGLFERSAHGIYRLSRFPASAHEDLVVAWLRGGSQSVISHDSAMALYGLSDLLPTEIHVTIPRTGSRRRPGIRLHTSQLRPEDITHREGLPVTTVARTAADLATRGIQDWLVVQAIHEALKRGLTSKAEVERQATRSPARVKRVLMDALASHRR